VSAFVGSSKSLKDLKDEEPKGPKILARFALRFATACQLLENQLLSGVLGVRTHTCLKSDEAPSSDLKKPFFGILLSLSEPMDTPRTAKQF
jgi:hypothetical protein